MIIRINPDNPDEKKIEKITSLFLNGSVIVYPTDTIYGMGCIVNSNNSVKRIFEIKDRKKGTPLSIICKDLEWVRKNTCLNEKSEKILKNHLPGPYTFILKIKEGLSGFYNNYHTVGIRIPDCNLTRQVVDSLDHPITTTSVNRSGEEPVNDPEIIISEFGYNVDLIVDCGILESLPSTIVDLSQGEPKVLRLGKGDFII